MLELRVDRAERSVRVAMLGSLERTDLAHLLGPFATAATRDTVRIVIVKLWRLDPHCFRVLHEAVLNAREHGHACLWCGPLPQARALLEDADELPYVIAANSADLAATRWTSN